MSEPELVAKDRLIGSRPPLWSLASLREQIPRSIAQTKRCVVALDDDSAGTPAVHGGWAVTDWDVATLAAVLVNPSVQHCSGVDACCSPDFGGAYGQDFSGAVFR